MKTAAYAATAADRPLAPFTLERREPGLHDVAIDILYCGLCHSDIMQARNELGRSRYPMVPGHEIVGRVARVGAGVTRVKAGDIVGVGGMVDACRECLYCREGHEQFCRKGAASTYNGTEMDRTTPTYGGYSKHIVVTEPFVLKIPASLQPAAAAPLLCAGITTYSALRQWNVKEGDRVGVVGLGGLGHLAVKIAAAMGAEVTALSTSRTKEADAQRLGAKHFALTTEPETIEKLASRFHLLLVTVASPQHQFAPYLSALRPYGTLVVLGLTAPAPVSGLSLILGNKRIAGSAIGGIRENQEMLDFCGEHGIAADIEIIPADEINEAHERMLKGDVRYRFVLDAATL
ncbi:NAD(P)-dependent alcohol dehydrogenase [Sorangium sp. So ce134]